MYISVRIEDLAGNAFAELMQAGDNRTVLSYVDLERYGRSVVSYINRNTDKKAALSLSREETDNFFDCYNDMFVPGVDKKGETGVMKKDGVTARLLWDNFQSYLPDDLLKAYSDRNNIAALSAPHKNRHRDAAMRKQTDKKRGRY